MKFTKGDVLWKSEESKFKPAIFVRHLKAGKCTINVVNRQGKISRETASVQDLTFWTCSLKSIKFQDMAFKKACIKASLSAKKSQTCLQIRLEKCPVTDMKQAVIKLSKIDEVLTNPPVKEKVQTLERRHRYEQPSDENLYANVSKRMAKLHETVALENRQRAAQRGVGGLNPPGGSSTGATSTTGPSGSRPILAGPILPTTPSIQSWRSHQSVREDSHEEFRGGFGASSILATQEDQKP